ncbi:EAL domain-containing protein [Carboxydothermus ferrireducens]|uniref:EAL domain-containing protein (Putative c-di-GMP-specific phosphodiesterase class I) n=1 Tax=Carboxydothermus ferrireducens DSM 11255 TaxID=1119529 RepID=A0ABX2RAR5_9THEO|nr:EAL domain-containing protein [Carboxydothermus ferrireducens]NYE57163.1 EAL domain-containing protein (putative c-di-GMP-specific phosphodiesterase class I) [Carboxydothermus ferrireducens DSM 11255]
MVYDPRIFDFCLAFQPIYNLNGLKLIGYEVLLRFKHFNTPEEGLRELQKEGLLPFWELKVIEEALLRKQEENCLLFVNLTPEAFLSKEFHKQAKILMNGGSSNFCVEISEKTVYNETDYRRALERWLEAGSYVGIDDFGTKGANLDLVVAGKPDFVKFDRRLVSGVAENPDQRKILFTLADTMGKLNIFPVFEGVEKSSDFEQITQRYKNAGVQGFLLGKPQIIGGGTYKEVWR